LINFDFRHTLRDVRISSNLHNRMQYRQEYLSLIYTVLHRREKNLNLVIFQRTSGILFQFCGPTTLLLCMRWRWRYSVYNSKRRHVGGIQRRKLSCSCN